MRKAKLFLIIPLLFALMGCAVLQSIGVTVKPWGEMTSQEKMLYALKTYNTQYEDYWDMVLDPKLAPEVKQAIRLKVLPWEDKYQNPNLTLGQKKVLNTKKQILVEIYPLIEVAKKAVDGGQPITPELSMKLNGMINRLISGI